jgi:hypothetical protein
MINEVGFCFGISVTLVCGSGSGTSDVGIGSGEFLSCTIEIAPVSRIICSL